MYVKFMSCEDLPDSDSRKSFELIEGVLEVEFGRDDEGAFADLTLADEYRHVGPLKGNVYVLNDAGRTLQSFGPANPER